VVRRGDDGELFRRPIGARRRLAAGMVGGHDVWGEDGPDGGAKKFTA
jgi:hypothetical protein